MDGSLPMGIGGFGPWYCSLLFNTSKDSKKQTHLIAHSNPGLFPVIMNHRLRPHSSGRCGKRRKRTGGIHTGVGWVMMQKIGPVSSWGNCVAFLSLWTDRTRGKSRRLERGVELFSAYANTEGENLTLWSIMDTKDAVMKRKRIRREEESRCGTTKMRGSCLGSEHDFYTAMNALEAVFAVSIGQIPATVVKVQTIKDFEKT